MILLYALGVEMCGLDAVSMVACLGGEGVPGKLATYRTIEQVLPLISRLLNMALQGAGVKRFQKLETAKELRGHRHDGSPVIKLAAVLATVSKKRSYKQGIAR